MSERQKRKLAQREANRLKKRMIEKVLALKTNNYAPNLNCLVDGWLELESDPGTFSLLIEDFGCFGAQVEEIYDLDQKFESPVFGFIFLFKWLNQHQTTDRSRERNYGHHKSASNNSIEQANNEQQQQQNSSNQGQGRSWSYVQDEEKINEMFFAKQMISNSCATHALISVLLNCAHEELSLGPTLTKLKEHTKVMDPENRGYAIGNLPEIAKAHNSHASFSSLYNRNKPPSHLSYMISGNQRTNLQQQKKHEAYHFVSYVPIKNRLYELDGLKNYPIDHGPLDPKKDWTEKFKQVIKQRLANRSGDDPTVSNDIRYNLMAVVPDKRSCLRTKIKILKNQRELIKNSMDQKTKRTEPISIDVDIPNPPYSPLSNATLTASESGSPPHSSSSNEGNGYNSDEEPKLDKYFFIKFSPTAESTRSREENIEPAHKSCIVEVDSTSVHPLNLKLDANKIKLEEDQEKDSESSIYKSPELCPDEVKPTSDETTPPNEKRNNGLAITDSDEKLEEKLDEQPEKQQDKQPEEKLNETPAHKNEKYNLSNKPPFEFNIMDVMQHWHTDKSTLKDMAFLSQRLNVEIESVEATLRDEIEKRRKYKVDNSRRTHNYEPFIMTFLSLLASHGKLADLVERDLGIVSEDSNNQPPPSAVVKVAPVKEAPKNVVKPRYRYVSTGRPVGRPRKNPLVVTPANNKTTNA